MEEVAFAPYIFDIKFDSCYDHKHASGHSRVGSPVVCPKYSTRLSAQPNPRRCLAASRNLGQKRKQPNASLGKTPESESLRLCSV
jgi:hypothetical protein